MKSQTRRAAPVYGSSTNQDLPSDSKLAQLLAKLEEARRRNDRAFENDLQVLIDIARPNCPFTPDEEEEIAEWPIRRLDFSSKWLWRLSRGYTLAELHFLRTGEELFETLARDSLEVLGGLRNDSEAHWRVRRQANDVYMRGRRLFPSSRGDALDDLS